MSWWSDLWAPEERHEFVTPEPEPATVSARPAAEMTKTERWQENERQKLAAVASALAELLPKRGQFIERQMAFHAVDFDSFAIDCERTADFLTLSITRLANVTPSVIDEDQRKERAVTVVKGINLSTVTGIDIVRGSPPGRDRALWAYINYHIAKDGAGMVADISQWEITPRPQPVWVEPLAGCEDRYESGRYFISNEVRCEQDFPYPAVDDTVRFTGLGASIRAPYGRGEEALAEVMRAIGQRAAA